MDNKMYFRFSVEGEQVVLGDAHVDALSLDDLLSFEAGAEFNLKVSGEAIGSSSLAGSKRVNVSAKFISEYTNQCFALVRSGWLPPVFALTNALIVPDRNIISDISSRFCQGEVKPRVGQQKDFFDLFVEYEYDAQISLAPFALEGNLKRRPSREDVVLQLNEASNKVSQALPGLKQTPVNEWTITGVMGILEDSHEEFYKRLRFLMSSISMLGNTAGKMRRMTVWERIFELASQSDLSRTDFCVILAVMAVTAPNRCNPARGILKPKADYSEQDAYNALCDIQLLSLYIQVLHNFPNEKAVLLTKDISIAKLWAAIAPLETLRRSPYVNCDFKVSRIAFPIDEYWEGELKRFIKG